MKTTKTQYLPLGLTITGPDACDKYNKIRDLTIDNLGIYLLCSCIADGRILEISKRYSRIERERARDFARGVLATLES